MKEQVKKLLNVISPRKISIESFLERSRDKKGNPELLSELKDFVISSESSYMSYEYDFMISHVNRLIENC